MRNLLVFGFICVQFASAETPLEIWNAAKAKREAYPGLHQELAVTRQQTTSRGPAQLKSEMIVDFAGSRWRELTASGSGRYIRLFDGKVVTFREDGGSEFEVLQKKWKDAPPQPGYYTPENPNWEKASVAGTPNCSVGGKVKSCVQLTVPVKPSRKGSGAAASEVKEGVETLVIDPESGLMLMRRSVLRMELTHYSYSTTMIKDETFETRRASFAAAADTAIFEVPAHLKEVKEITPWTAPRIKKELVGMTAPDFNVTDIDGKPVKLESLRGKIVLLDFWTTWCPPCRADAPSIEKLHKKYGGRDLVVVGFSVSESREVVAEHLSKHPAPYSIVLTSENEIPRPYQMMAFPTYMIIGRDGTLESVVQGDQGFGELRRLLKKSGLEVD